MSSIQIVGVDSLRERLANITSGIMPAAKVAAEDAMQTMKADAVKNCPVDTGELRGSIQTKVEIVDDGLDARLYSTSEHAIYVEMGTGPVGEANHADAAPVPVTYRATGWTYHDEDGFHYTRGQPARPFLYPAFKANKRVVLGKVLEAVRKTVKGE